MTTAFDKYIGHKVLVKETTEKVDIGGQDEEITEYHVNDKDTVITKITTEAKKVGLQMRTWLPGNRGTMDYHTDRLNVYVEKQEDGSFQIVRVSIG